MATDPRVETLRLLTSMDASLKAISLALVRILDAQGDREEGVTRTPVSTAMLDGPHGDPIVKAKDPRDWAGEPMKGRKFSECPPEYLDLLAERHDYFASKEEDHKKAGYERKDAARARGWAARLRAGYVAPTTPAPQSEGEPTW